MTAPRSLFAQYHDQAYAYRYDVTILCRTIAGPAPTNQHVTEAWLKTKVAPGTTDEQIRAEAARIMVEREVGLEEAMREVDELRHLNGFKIDSQGLFLDGNSAKAMLKEAVSVAIAAGNIELRGWGETSKFLTKFFPEHVFVVENKIHFHDGAGEPVTKPAGVNQRFVHTWRGSSIQLEEIGEDVYLSFTIEADFDFGEDFWGVVMATGEMQGIGASRSQGYGRFTVTRWEQAKTPARKTAKVAPPPKRAKAATDGDGDTPKRGRKTAPAKA
jgi:hypothetical protein